MQAIEFERYDPEKHGSIKSKRGRWQRVLKAALAENTPVAVKAPYKNGTAALHNAAKALKLKITTRYTDEGFIVVEVLGPLDESASS